MWKSEKEIISRVMVDFRSPSQHVASGALVYQLFGSRDGIFGRKGNEIFHVEECREKRK